METRPASITLTDKQSGSCFKNWPKRRPESKNPAPCCFQQGGMMYLFWLPE
jgi:hypothetical protein